MKTIGLLGGMSWESTLGYYRTINLGIRAELGSLHSAQIAMISVDFAPIEQCQQAGDWDQAAALLTEAAQGVEAAGADFLVICTNTMHKVAPQIEAALTIPLLHIADATAQQLITAGIQRVGLLGTAFTMTEPFYKGRLTERYGLEVITPNAPDRAVIHDIIYTELCQGVIEPASRDRYLTIIDNLAAQGAEAVILGCTEIGLLVKPTDTTVPLFDTAAIHAEAAVNWAIA